MDILKGMALSADTSAPETRATALIADDGAAIERVCASPAPVLVMDNFSTAAGMSDGSNVMGSQESMQCRPVPQVKWWKIRNHESVASYVNQRYRGNWGAYIEDWLQRLAKVQDIFDRGAGAVTSTGVRLQGKTLSSYINQIQKQQMTREKFGLNH